MMLSPLVWCVKVSTSDDGLSDTHRQAWQTQAPYWFFLGAKCCIVLHNSRLNKLVLDGVSAVLAHLRQKSSNPQYNRGRGIGNYAEG